MINFIQLEEMVTVLKATMGLTVACSAPVDVSMESANLRQVLASSAKTACRGCFVMHRANCMDAVAVKTMPRGDYVTRHTRFVIAPCLSLVMSVTVKE